MKKGVRREIVIDEKRIEQNTTQWQKIKIKIKLGYRTKQNHEGNQNGLTQQKWFWVKGIEDEVKTLLLPHLQVGVR